MDAGIDQRRAQMLAGFAICLVRYGHAAGACDRFQADGDIHVVAEHLVLVGDHVAHMDAHSEPHGAVGGQLGVALGHQHLHRYRALDRADDTGELEQKTVASVLHQPAAMIEDDGIDRAAMRLERGMRAGLVGPHHAGIADDISTNDGCQASLHRSPKLQSLRQPLRDRLAEANAYRTLATDK